MTPDSWSGCSPRRSDCVENSNGDSAKQYPHPHAQFQCNGRSRQAGIHELLHKQALPLEPWRTFQVHPSSCELQTVMCAHGDRVTVIFTRRGNDENDLPPTPLAGLGRTNHPGCAERRWFIAVSRSTRQRVCSSRPPVHVEVLLGVDHTHLSIPAAEYLLTYPLPAQPHLGF